MKKTFEQQPQDRPGRRRSDRVVQAKSELVTLTLRKCGDEGVDAGLVDLYQSLGFQVKGETPAGSLELQMPRDQVDRLGKASIEEHYRRAKGAERASLGPEVKLVEDRSEKLNPKSAQELIGAMKLEDDPEI